jgi:hypothetical protein
VITERVSFMSLLSYKSITRLPRYFAGLGFGGGVGTGGAVVMMFAGGVSPPSRETAVPPGARMRTEHPESRRAEARALKISLGSRIAFPVLPVGTRCGAVVGEVSEAEDG